MKNFSFLQGFHIFFFYQGILFPLIFPNMEFSIIYEYFYRINNLTLSSFIQNVEDC